MLVTFMTDAHENISMFKEIAVQLIRMMGHSGAIPGAIMAQDVHLALDSLQAHLKNIPNVPQHLHEDEEEGRLV